jgi:CubicO group peptidase (beta-lactamase class C family)
MSSGVRWSEDYTDRNFGVNRYSKWLGNKVPGGVLALMRSLPAEVLPGSRFSYCTGDTHVLGCLVSAAMGEPQAETMSRASGAPRAWNSTPATRWNRMAARRSAAAAPASHCVTSAASGSSFWMMAW